MIRRMSLAGHLLRFVVGGVHHEGFAAGVQCCGHLVLLAGLRLTGDHHQTRLPAVEFDVHAVAEVALAEVNQGLRKHRPVGLAFSLAFALDVPRR